MSTLSTPFSHVKIAIQVIALSSSDKEDEVTTKKRKVSAIKHFGSVPLFCGAGCTFPQPTPPSQQVTNGDSGTSSFSKAFG